MDRAETGTENPSAIPRLEATEAVVPPAWALWERRLIDVMNQAGVTFVERYTRPDGTLVWRDDWPGMDGSDDAYESFYTFPLFYLLGGSEEIHRLGRMEWEALTWQFTEYGQIYREFDAYYDWMHHGESYLYLYFLGLADPYVLKDRQRAVRFAGFYTGEDEEAQNYDPALKLIRSPINGSRGPRFEITAEDWSTHRDVLRHFPTPFEDLPGVPGPRADWTDDALFAEILTWMNERMARGDVPLNLLATSLVTHAYLYTGEREYRDWVLEYLDAWQQRTAANHGIMPDNVGLSGQIGEYMEGKWWGGYYGWRWPHGAMNLLEAAAVAGANAVLLTGDLAHLDLARSQLDLLWSLRREEDGQWVVPHKHHDGGWTDYRPMSPALPLQLWNLSQAEEDLERLLRLPDPERWDHELTVRGVGWAPGASWFRYLRGHLPDYPETILRASYGEVCRTLEAIRSDDRDPKSVYIQHWIGLNPVICEALLQLTTGAPYPIYHGGLLHGRVLHFDPEKGRPGLPEDVAALVEAVCGNGFRLQLVNLDPQRPRRVILQAGAFGEHEFIAALPCSRSRQTSGQSVNSPWLEIALGPAAGLTVDLTTRRYVNAPKYQFPWAYTGKDLSFIKLRTPQTDPGVLRFTSWD